MRTRHSALRFVRSSTHRRGEEMNEPEPSARFWIAPGPLPWWDSPTARAAPLSAFRASCRAGLSYCPGESADRECTGRKVVSHARRGGRSRSRHCPRECLPRSIPCSQDRGGHNSLEDSLPLASGRRDPRRGGFTSRGGRRKGSHGPLHPERPHGRRLGLPAQRDAPSP